MNLETLVFRNLGARMLVSFDASLFEKVSGFRFGFFNR